MPNRARAGSSPTRLLVADGCFAFRAGLRQALEREGDIVAAEAGTGAEAVRVASSVAWDLALIDVRFSDQSGIDVCQQIRSANPAGPALVLSCADWDVYLAGSVAVGARGFVLKHAQGDQLLALSHQALMGPVFTPSQLARARAFGASVVGRLELASPRELDTLKLLAVESCNAETAKKLGVSENTVQKHVSALMRKLRVRSRSALIAFLFQHRLDEEFWSSQWWKHEARQTPDSGEDGYDLLSHGLFSR